MQAIEKIDRRESKDSPSLHKCRLCCREYTTAAGLKRHIKDKHPEQFANYGLPPGHPAHVMDICRKIEKKRDAEDKAKASKMKKQVKDKQAARLKAVKPKRTIVLAEQYSKEPKDNKGEDIAKQLDNLSKEVKKLRANLQ